MTAAGIIFSNLNERTLSRMTTNRTVAAIPFGCRYRLVDFVLSSMVNAGIENISVIANYNYRSLTEHIGSGKDWDLARRDGGIRLISPYQTSKTPNAAMYSHHMEALKNMEEFIREIKEDYVILSDTNNISNYDFEEILKYHEEKDADITLVCTEVPDTFTQKDIGIYVKENKDSKVVDVQRSSAAVAGYKRFANIYIMKTTFLVNLLNDANSSAFNSLSQDVLAKHHEDYRFFVYTNPGKIGLISSFTDYYNVSMQLITDANTSDQLFRNKERPIFTRVHNSAPVIYSKDAKVTNSMIADGCDIEGTVENSIIFRGVKIGKGAVVKNSILFNDTIVGEDASLTCVVTDNSVVINDNTQLAGAPTLPFFIARNLHV